MASRSAIPGRPKGIRNAMAKANNADRTRSTPAIAPNEVQQTAQ